MTNISCGECGIVFEVPVEWQKKRLEDKKIWYCPNGHQRHFTNESEADKMRRERDIARQQLARAEDETKAERKRAERAERARQTLRRRVAAGTCPCCHRTFSNMARHIKQKHPDLVADVLQRKTLKAA